MEEEFMRIESEQEWETLYKKIFEESRRHSSQASESDSNISLNRYQDVRAYDKTRVKLQRATETDYINANLVTVPKAARQYILTQGPLPETLGHFWLMIWEQKSNIIIMLNKIVEYGDFVKCEQYWPSAVDETLRLEDVGLEVKLISREDKKHYAVREMILEDCESGKSRTVTQFHYTAWPDHGQPDSPTSFLRLLSAVRKSGGLDKMDEPSIVHCSAGIGRSGTFCLIDSILSMVENQGSTEGIDIVSTLIEMRDYRMGLIQSPIQLRFAYMSIIYGIKILRRANMLQPHISSIKDSTAHDNDPSQQQIINGSAHNNGKKTRRNRRKQNSSNSGSLNIFKKHLLVEALDDIDSDSADFLFDDTMRPCPNLKKPRSSSPFKTKSADQLGSSSKKDLSDVTNQGTSTSTGSQLLDKAIKSFSNANTISTSSPSSKEFTAKLSQPPLGRRELREQKNQRLSEKTMEIKNRMKAEEAKRDVQAKRMAFLKRSAVVGGVAALVISSIAYIYLHGSSSS